MNVFDFVNAINDSKADLFEDPQAEKDYVPFVVNRAFSYFPDTVMIANVINQYSGASKEMQFDFYRAAVPKRKRFAKWAKKQASSEDLTAVMNYYKYSSKRALEAMTLLSDEQIRQIKHRMDTGGNNGPRRDLL